jgi:hypothetical protein
MAEIMQTRILAVSVLALVFPSGALARNSKSWSNLAELKPGEQVVVMAVDGARHRGAFRGYSDEAITIREGNRDLTTERTQVQAITVSAPSHRLRNTLIGLGIGAGAGLALDRSLGAYLRNESNPPGARALIWGLPIAIGGTIGAVIPGQRTIYSR